MGEEGGKSRWFVDDEKFRVAGYALGEMDGLDWTDRTGLE